jgi:hypothetical protein
MSLLAVLTKRIIMKRLFKQLIAKIAAKDSGAATFTVAGALVAVGAWLELHPDVVYLIPMEYQGVGLLVVGALVGIARARSLLLQKTDQAPKPLDSKDP